MLRTITTLGKQTTLKRTMCTIIPQFQLHPKFLAGYNLDHIARIRRPPISTKRIDVFPVKECVDSYYEGTPEYNLFDDYLKLQEEKWEEIFKSKE